MDYFLLNLTYWIYFSSSFLCRHDCECQNCFEQAIHHLTFFILKEKLFNHALAQSDKICTKKIVKLHKGGLGSF